MNSNLNMNENRVANMLDLVNKQDAVNQRHLESTVFDYLGKDGTNTATNNDLDLGNDHLKNTGDPTDGKDAVNKNYADLALPKAGGLMSGAIKMNGNEILGLTSIPPVRLLGGQQNLRRQRFLQTQRQQPAFWQHGRRREKNHKPRSPHRRQRCRQQKIRRQGPRCPFGAD